jgi:outer membrane receptor protein involved in Fe transport
VQTGLELDIFQNSSFKIDSSLRQRDKTFRLFYMNSSYEYQTTLDTVTLSPQLVLRQDLGAFGNRLIVGLDYSVAEEDISGGTELEKRSLAYYLHDEIELIRGLTLSGGYRHDKAHYAFTPSEPDHADLRQDVYNIGLNYAFSEGSHLYASYARSYRYPLLDEIFLFSGSIDTTLKEQTSDHYEVGLGYAASERLRLNLALFHIITRTRFSMTRSIGRTPIWTAIRSAPAWRQAQPGAASASVWE